MPEKEKVVGILGGMGPEATVDLMRRIIRNTPAQDDIDHVRCIIDNNPKVPSRIKALIEGTGENPGPVMAEMAKNLRGAGADFLCIACNTAHNYYDYVYGAVDIPVLNMIELAADAALRASPSAARIGILASPAVRTTGLYENVLALSSSKAAYLDPEAENALLDIIKRVKKGDLSPQIREMLANVVNSLRDKGVKTAIAACTELGVIMEGESYEIEIIDAAEVLARAIVREAKPRV